MSSQLCATASVRKMPRYPEFFIGNIVNLIFALCILDKAVIQLVFIVRFFGCKSYLNCRQCMDYQLSKTIVSSSCLSYANEGILGIVLC